MLILLLLFCSGGILSCLWCSFFRTLVDPADGSAARRNIVILSAVDGLLWAALAKVTPYGMGTGIFSAVLCLECYLVLQKKREADWIFYLGLFLATMLLLTFVPIVIIVLLSLFLEDFALGSPGARATVYGGGALILANVFFYLFRSKFYPSQAVRRLFFHSQVQRKVILSCLALFSVSNLIILDFFCPRLYRLELSSVDRNLMGGVLLLATASMIGGFYLMVYYLCRFTKSEEESRALNISLSDEMQFRQNILSDALLSYCANLTADRFERGEIFGRQIHNERKQNASYREDMGIFIQRFVHPDDRQVLEAFAQESTADLCFRDADVFTARVRLVNPSRIKSIDYAWLGRNEPLETPDTGELWHWSEVRFIRSRDKLNGATLLYAAARDVHSDVITQERLKKAAEHDSLTGLYNRGTFVRLLDSFLQEVTPQGTLYLIDLDGFKSVNDNMGHPEGDELLMEVARLLEREFRTDDLVARVGGDEFAVFSIGMRSMQAIEQRAQSLNRGLRKHYTGKDGQDFVVSLSIGIAIAPLCGSDFKTLYHNADTALYLAKESGRNGYALCTCTSELEDLSI